MILFNLLLSPLIRFLGRAQDVQRLMGAGNVYVGSQPTGIADITIVVGKDFTGA